MKKIFIVGIVVIIAAMVVLFWKLGNKQIVNNPIASSTPIANLSISDATIKFEYSSKEFGLATNQTQILVHSYIPPCDSDFNYCLYYIGNKYEGTNFESAGIRIKNRSDIYNERLCLNTPPSDFDANVAPDSMKSSDKYSSSIFSNIGDAGAGHSASGSLYRLYVKSNSSCYEFETRIGQTQFLNYPAGTIKEFTPEDMKNMKSELLQIIGQISLSSGEKNLLPIFTDYKNATYLIEGQKVTLTDGREETQAAPGSASKTISQYFGNIAFGDLNGDKLPDAGFIITQSGGGSGTFYYAVAALKNSEGYSGTNAVFLGDRISPQTTEIKNGELIINYADRKPGEPMTENPSVGISKYLKVQGITLK